MRAVQVWGKAHAFGKLLTSVLPPCGWSSKRAPSLTIDICGLLACVFTMRPMRVIGTPAIERGIFVAAAAVKSSS